MSDVFGNGAVWMGLQLLVKASMLVGAALVVQWLIGARSSAAARHLSWSIVVIGLLVLPLLSAVLPTWEVALPVSRSLSVVPANGDVDPSPGAPDSIVRSSAVDSPSASAAPATDAPPMQEKPSMSWPTALVVLYAWGALVLLTYLAAEQLSVRRLAMQATEIVDDGWRQMLDECRRSLRIEHPVRLLRSRQHTMPMVFGLRSPAILLPAIADTWDDDRRRAVVLHELAHVSRRDCLTQTLGAIACAAYWPHPGVWWIARRLRIERELACDDLVLTAGTSARDYAGHLLELAHTLGGGRAPALVVTMARPRQLEGRMLAVMDADRSRVVPGIRTRLASVAVAAALVVPLASADAVVVNATAALPPDTNVALPPDTSAVAHASTEFPRQAPPSETSRRTRGVANRTEGSDGIQQSTFRGTWEIRQSPKTGTVHLRLTEGDWSSGFSIPVDRLEGISSAQLAGASGPVKFSMRRDAGTFAFEGTARDGVAGGVFYFSPNTGFGPELEKRGYGRPTDAEQYSLARGDIGFAFLDELTKQGYSRPSISQLVRAGDHGAHFDYLREMGAAGYRLGSIDTLIRLRDHGVTPDFIRELSAQNVKNLSADELQRIRDHGVNGEYIREFRELGFGSATVEQLVTARDHGVNPDYVREMTTLSQRKLTLEELIRMRDHGVGSNFARELRDLGQTLTVEELVKARDHGVSTDFVRELASLGYRNLPLETLVRLRDHGVTPSFVSELKTLGYDKLDLEDLVSLKDHGVTPDKIRRANDRAGTRLPLDMIRALANGGMK
jgi:beta-lactamase regulating signal transducer with metallopeptidase domain